ncbi:MAG: PilZ domain-containing protein [Deltaproteobacteria bacterium]|nr:PilZ domain-containing protein [Deltaproteobacteria bacterium]
MSEKPKGGGKNDSPFFEVKDPILIAKIFDVATRHHHKVTLWLKAQTVKFEAELTYDERVYKNMVCKPPLGFDLPGLYNLLANQGSSEILGSINIEHTNFFFKTTCNSTADDKYIHLGMPPSIFKLQRRQAMRIPFQRNFAPTLSVFDPTKTFDSSKPIVKGDILAMRMLDLSVGGCGVAAKIDEADKFAKGTKLRDLRFLVRGMEIVAEGEVKHVLKTTNDRGKPMLRVGIQFGQLKMDYETVIGQFVLDESRKIFTLLQ